LTSPILLLSWNTDIDGSNLCVLTSSATDDWITINYVKVHSQEKLTDCLAHPVISVVTSVSIFSVASRLIAYLGRIPRQAVWPSVRLPDLKIRRSLTRPILITSCMVCFSVVPSSTPGPCFVRHLQGEVFGHGMLF